jgi:hypothetical protein
MGTYPSCGDITEVPPGAADYFILLSFSLALSLSLSLSLSLLLQHTRDPHILNILSTRETWQVAFSVCKIYTKDAKRFLVYGRCAFSHRYLPDLPVKQQSYGVGSVYQGGASRLLLHNISTCVRNFTCRIKSSY